MASTPAHPPKKPANQGGKAPANVQPVNAWEKSASPTNSMEATASSGGGWQNHSNAPKGGGTRGSGKGAR
jgi:hypothetical protein